MLLFLIFMLTIGFLIIGFLLSVDEDINGEFIGIPFMIVGLIAFIFVLVFTILGVEGEVKQNIGKIESISTTSISIDGDSYYLSNKYTSKDSIKLDQLTINELVQIDYYDGNSDSIVKITPIEIVKKE